jgi:hypothetical protein
MLEDQGGQFEHVQEILDDVLTSAHADRKGSEEPEPQMVEEPKLDTATSTASTSEQVDPEASASSAESATSTPETVEAEDAPESPTQGNSDIATSSPESATSTPKSSEPTIVEHGQEQTEKKNAEVIESSKKAKAAELPAPGGIRALLEGKSAAERANVKSEELIKIFPTGEYTDPTYDVDVEVQGIEKIDGGIQIFARAWKGEDQLGFGEDGSVEIERFRIFNPPSWCRMVRS